ncbi:MAG: cytidine deaminase [Saprospiraceae bacterium]|jgi:cytidine deaminase|nr:cytidine deaminase [Saprospiraceae bacterium]HRD80506.1 cytidine deaminase [Saprospiraceae bacterium]HRJ16506.1 cytidine deaminase [Saprospiraceae bacterium]HRK83313.1 cytidine deaminase [Saprospiraceae bacterium]
MKQNSIQIDYIEYESLDAMPADDVALIEKAIEIAQKSYSPYSKFPVGAAVRLDNGEMYAGNNQENVAYPSGTCAERTVLNYVNANFPDHNIEAIAITSLKSNSSIPITPCGFCRQVIMEMEYSQQQKIRIILHKIGGPTYVFQSAPALLPLAFIGEMLQ